MQQLLGSFLSSLSSAVSRGGGGVVSNNPETWSGYRLSYVYIASLYNTDLDTVRYLIEASLYDTFLALSIITLYRSLYRQAALERVPIALCRSLVRTRRRTLSLDHARSTRGQFG
jgi:hypothetical protein